MNYSLRAISKKYCEMRAINIEKFIGLYALWACGIRNKADNKLPVKCNNEIVNRPTHARLWGLSSELKNEIDRIDGHLPQWPIAAWRCQRVESRNKISLFCPKPTKLLVLKTTLIVIAKKNLVSGSIYYKNYTRFPWRLTRGRRKNMLLGRASGIRSLFQRYSPVGVLLLIIIHVETLPHWQISNGKTSTPPSCVV